MRIKNIDIKDFRLFEDINFNLGKYLTVIGGKNAIGKSTLLGMLGNAAELKVHKPILHNRFRTEFSEIFKGSIEFDPSSSNKFKINFCGYDNNQIIDHRTFRVAWQDGRTRFRIIPRKKLEDGKQTEAKVQWPTLYLGLGRLMPIGEINDDNMSSTNLKLNEKEERWFIDNYNKILSLNEEPQSISQIKINNTIKNGIGISTDKYSFLSNSAGQDNIGQILCSLLSFKRLKKNLGDKYKGGLLLIDEIDVTLHPFAQNSLIQLLIKQAKKLKIQVVCTTHSISLLKYITEKIFHNDNSKDAINKIELLYLTNENYKLEINRNPELSYIENELYISSIVQNNKKIKIYVEDDEAKWFLEKLIAPYMHRVDIISSKLGDENLMTLNKLDPGYFSNVIIVLDGDTPSKEIEQSTPIRNNILQLPGDERPESVFYEYILGLDSIHDFWIQGKTYGFSKIYFETHGPESYCNSTEREKYKNWFVEHLPHFDSIGLYSFWENSNKGRVGVFNSGFCRLFNDIAKSMRLPLI